MDDSELERLLCGPESDRVERKASLSDRDRIRQAICAFANDLPSHQKPGVMFIGVNDDGTCAHLSISEQLLLTLADMRFDGNITPFPTLTVQMRTLLGCEMAVMIVEPTDAPPVRFKGQVWIRVGPRRGIASSEEERRLAEKRRWKDLPHDLHPLASASLSDLDLVLFRRVYLPAALPAEVLEDNSRSLEEQLMALRFTGSEAPYHPTVLGLLIAGKSPSDFVPGAYVQFLRIEGIELTDRINNSHELHGPATDVLRTLDNLLEVNISTAADITSESREIRSSDYPLAALQQLVRNAVMHRDYQTTTAPVRITWFDDRIEIQNPGGPFGQVTCENFGQPGITDYRNPHLAEAMKNLGYVQRFGVGIQLARKALNDNGNPQPEFVVEPHHVLVVVRSGA